MTLDDVSNLSTLGIDEARGAAAMALDNDNVIVALPISSHDNFLKVASQLFPARIVLSSEETSPGADPDGPDPDTPEPKVEDAPDPSDDSPAATAPKKVAT